MSLEGWQQRFWIIKVSILYRAHTSCAYVALILVTFLSFFLYIFLLCIKVNNNRVIGLSDKFIKSFCVSFNSLSSETRISSVERANNCGFLLVFFLEFFLYSLLCVVGVVNLRREFIAYKCKKKVIL